MKAYEIKEMVNQIAHECSNYEYYMLRNNDTLGMKADYAIDTLLMLCNRFDVSVTIVRDTNLNYSAVFAPIGKMKMYFRWVTSCNKNIDDSTYTEFKEAIIFYLNNGYECYTTDGNNGMQKINNEYDI